MSGNSTDSNNVNEFDRKVRIAHLAGPTATIQNSPPLVTSNKARTKYGLPLRTNPDGSPQLYDALRAQRLAAPVKIYVEQFSGHPLERDAFELYGKPDGYIGPDGKFTKEQDSSGGKPVYEIELSPEDGLYPLPYMARKKDGGAWEEEATVPGGREDDTRQAFFPDGSRSFEEIDRLSLGIDGVPNLISSLADVDFYRVLPPGGYKKGLAADLRTDIGNGDIAPETRHREYHSYKPSPSSAPPRPSLAKITNDTQSIVDSGKYDGVVWTQGSPQIEETIYWFNLLIDTALPICGNAAQRRHGQISADGPKNIVDSIAYIKSGVWKNRDGKNRCGSLLVQEQQFFAAREVAKVDARPGGYAALGGHGGVIGQISHSGKVTIMYLPAYKHTYQSEVTLKKLPSNTKAATRHNGKLEFIDIAVKDEAGHLIGNAIPSVSIIKVGGYSDEEYDTNPDDVSDMLALIEHKLCLKRLAGFVTEGIVPYGRLPSPTRERLLQRAAFSGIPTVRVGRGGSEGFADSYPTVISGSNLTATKARLLLMACLMKFGALPIAADPDQPTSDERAHLIQAVKHFQEIFDSH